MKFISDKQYLFKFFVLSLAVMSVSIGLMPLSDPSSEMPRIVSVIIGILFWIGFIGTVFAVIRLYLCQKRDGTRDKMEKRQVGLVLFFKNKLAIVFDSMMFASILGFVLTKACMQGILVPFIFLALVVFSFGMHCMLNGSTYEYITDKR